jgi:hypothetical protein
VAPAGGGRTRVRPGGGGTGGPAPRSINRVE